MTSPRVTIVIGVLNGAKTLERCIDSIVEQTLRPELIIKDAVSTDGTLEILARRDADIDFWESKPDKGLYDAWNTVIDRCHGDYITFLGCDDVMADRFALERVMAQVPQDNPPDLVCSLNTFVDDDGKFMRVIGNPWSWRALRRSFTVAHAGLMHHRRLFAQHGGFDTSFRIGGDYDFLLRLGPDTRTQFVDQILVRVGASGMSHTKWRQTYREHWRLQARHLGMPTATKNYTGNVARYLLRKLRGRR